MRHTAAAMAAAHRFIWHDTGQGLLEAKLGAIAAAQSSVDMETFVFRDSDIGQRFRDGLSAVGRRGCACGCSWIDLARSN